MCLNFLIITIFKRIVLNPLYNLPSYCYCKGTRSRIGNALPKHPPPLGGGALPSLPRICQLSAIKADYWPPLAPPPSSARRSEGVRPSERLTGPSDAGRRGESEDGLGFSIGADPRDRRPVENPWPSRPALRRVRRSGGMANNRRR